MCVVACYNDFLWVVTSNQIKSNQPTYADLENEIYVSGAHLVVIVVIIILVTYPSGMLLSMSSPSV